MNKPTFDQVYDQHYDDVWRFLLHASADVHVALDLTSQTFFRACRAWPSFKPKVSIKAWLIRIAVNEWRRELRRRKIQRLVPLFAPSESENGEIEIADPEIESVAAEIERSEAYLSLHRALAELPERYATPLRLRYFEYLSIEEVATILGRPIGTVKSLVHRGIAMLRKHQGLREACGESRFEVSRLTVES